MLFSYPWFNQGVIKPKGNKKADGSTSANPSAFSLSPLSLFKSTLRAKAHTLAAENALPFINLRQGIQISLCNSSLWANRYGRAYVVLRALLRVYSDFHVVSSPSSWQYSFLMASIKAITRSS